MSPPPDGSEADPYFCKCNKCSLHGGRVLPRTTWYNHNPGGKGTKAPKLSLEEIDYMVNLPAPKFTKARQRRFDEERANLRARRSNRDTGSSSVRTIGYDICAAIHDIYTQRSRVGRETLEGHDATIGTAQSTRRTNIVEPGCRIGPFVTPNDESDGTDRESPPPHPPTNEMEQDPPSPPPVSVIDDLGLDIHPGDREDPPGLDADEGILPPEPIPDEEILPPGPNPDGDSPPSDSDGEEDPPPSDSGDDADDGEGPLPDPDEGELHLTLEKMKTAHKFIEMAKAATLASQFSPGELVAFQNPQEDQFSPSDDQDLHLSIDFYISSLDHAESQKAYAKSRSNILKHFSQSNMLSYDQVKRRVSNLSGIVTWKHDMCFNTCIGFTGPFAELVDCPYCHEPRYDQRELKDSGGNRKVPRKSFTTFPLGPQIQARWRNPQMAQKMSYRRKKTQEELSCNRDMDDYVYDDVFCGSDYLEAVEKGHINDNDTVVMFSIDGAQLYRNKKSDCWIYIWLILDLAPEQRYKIRNILPGGIIPGPGHPKYLDSFLFPGLAHVSALQKEGLRIYNSYRREVYTSLLFLLLALADAIAMAELSGSVGHHGRRGCRLLCEFIGRNKPHGSHYYPALLKPLGVNDSSCNHDDYKITELPSVDPLKYREDLAMVISSQNNAQYQQRRLQTGIRKATIFECLPRILVPPTCFPGDIMHQPVINLTALMFDLWLDREGCRKGDQGGTWKWAVLKGNVWTTHGKAVAKAAVFFPRSFDRTPRNPAEKISSGYKAWELLLYFYGLGPGLFFGILPEEYYRHYCKLVVGIRIIYQRRISRQQLLHAHKLLLEWVLEFELLYYERKIERLHFVRQCVHSLTHLGPETARIGPPSLSAQWTMERIIGILGSLIKQPSNPFANLTEQAKKIAEINALVAIWPELDIAKREPHGSINIGHGYLLLGPKDEKPYGPSDAEQIALTNFYSGLQNPGSLPPKSIYRWGRLQIPTEQVARSHWKEVLRSSRTARTDRNLKVRHPKFRL